MSLLFIIGIILLCIRNKFAYLGALSLVSSISVPVMYYIPTGDLRGYYLIMRVVSQFTNLKYLFYYYKTLNNGNHQASSILYNIYQWLISRTGIFGLLPFISMIIVYLCCMMPFIHLHNKQNISLFTMFFGCLLASSLFPYLAVTSIVRFYLASGLFLILLYLYVNTRTLFHRYMFLPLFLALVFIHESMILPFLIVFICTIIKRIRLYDLFIFIVGFVFIFIIISKLKSGYSSGIVTITQSYMHNSSFTQNYQSIPTFVTELLDPYIYSIINVFLLRDNKIIINKLRLEINLDIMFNVVGICLMPYLVIAQRFSLCVGIINVILFIKILQEKGHINNIIKYSYFGIVLINLVSCYFYSDLMTFNFTNMITFYNY